MKNLEDDKNYGSTKSHKEHDDNKKPEPEYIFRNGKFTESQLKFMIGVSEKFFIFRFEKMLGFMLYHGVMYLISPFLMVPFIFVFERFNYKIIYNL